MGYFRVRYDSRVVYYNRRGFIRLATAMTKRFIMLRLSEGLPNFFQNFLQIFSFTSKMQKKYFRLFLKVASV